MDVEDIIQLDTGLGKGIIGFVLKKFLEKKKYPSVAYELADEILERIQRKLIEVGTEITAMTPGRHAVPTVQPEDIRGLEELIDSLDASLPPLNSFVIPGGSPAQAALHVARTVCRRAERRLVALLRADASFSRRLVAWFNRLGDLLFVLSRHCGR